MKIPLPDRLVNFNFDKANSFKFYSRIHSAKHHWYTDSLLYRALTIISTTLVQLCLLHEKK